MFGRHCLCGSDELNLACFPSGASWRHRGSEVSSRSAPQHNSEQFDGDVPMTFKVDQVSAARLSCVNGYHLQIIYETQRVAGTGDSSFVMIRNEALKFQMSSSRR
jgi:hypothetical protein